MEALLEEQVCDRDASYVRRNVPKTVLIIDESEETRDVLSTALERKGVRAFTASVLRRGAAIAREQKPDLVIFDLDSVNESPEEALVSFTRAGRLDEAFIMAIGSSKFEASIGEGEFISKPYHFAPLLQKIEQFLKSPVEVVLSDEEDIEVL
ncbi:MAG: hypothetical protein J6X44_12025 [Thermoguttaceae bacterium]|nr:hypothetical protein [Thermoguttaceae bacterium]